MPVGSRGAMSLQRGRHRRLAAVDEGHVARAQRSISHLLTDWGLLVHCLLESGDAACLSTRSRPIVVLRLPHSLVLQPRCNRRTRPMELQELGNRVQTASRQRPRQRGLPNRPLTTLLLAGWASVASHVTQYGVVEHHLMVTMTSMLHPASKSASATCRTEYQQPR